MDTTAITQQLVSLSQGPPRLRYSRQGVLGRGSFGEVVKAVDHQTKEVVAIKKMTYYPKYLRSMLREVSHLRSCANHPNIVKYHGLFHGNEALYMAMEFIEGTTAFDLVDHTPVTPSHISLITREVLKALEFIHIELQIIHHDLKLQNVLISRSGHVKLADFGLSISIHDQKENDIEFQGTAHYKAPDILRTSTYNTTVDIWALGICVYALARRNLPYPGVAYKDLDRVIFLNEQTPRLCYPHPADMQYFVLECLQAENRPGAVELLKHSFIQCACDHEELASLVQMICGEMKVKQGG